MPKEKMEKKITVIFRVFFGRRRRRLFFFFHTHTKSFLVLHILLIQTLNMWNRMQLNKCFVRLLVKFLQICMSSLSFFFA